jgi:hypothetical protein
VDADLTELIEIDPSRVDLVKNPANGFPILVMKAVNAQGGVDEKPDIAGAQSVLVGLFKLIAAEAQEGAAGHFCEIYDIQMLVEAICSMQCFLWNEEAGDQDDGEPIAKDARVSKAEAEGLVSYLLKRKISAAERKQLAGEGKALPDGSYPVENEEDLHNAAILARSGHGDVAAAKRLIAKRAKELGVANPLANDTAKDATVADQNEDKTPETPESQVEPQVEKSAAELLDEAVAKAVTPLQEVIKGLEAEMAVLKSTPVPGGPAVTTTATASEGQRAQSLAKAAYHDRLAKTVGDRELVRYHEEKAKEARQAANG